MKVLSNKSKMELKKGEDVAFDLTRKKDEMLTQIRNEIDENPSTFAPISSLMQRQVIRMSQGGSSIWKLLASSLFTKFESDLGAELQLMHGEEPKRCSRPLLY